MKHCLTTTLIVSQRTWKARSATQQWKSLKVETSQLYSLRSSMSYRKWKKKNQLAVKRLIRRNPLSNSSASWKKLCWKKIPEMIPNNAMRNRPLTFHYRMYVHYPFNLQKSLITVKISHLSSPIFITDPCLQPSENSSDCRNQPSPKHSQMLGDKQSTKFTAHFSWTRRIGKGIKKQIFFHLLRLK